MPGAGPNAAPMQNAGGAVAGAAGGAGPNPNAAGAKPMPGGGQSRPQGGQGGIPGGLGGGGSTPANPVSPVGSPEYSAEKVVVQLLSGSVSGLDEFISAKFKGPYLGDVREGKASDKQIEEMKKIFQGLQPVGKPRKESGATVLSVKNADGATITFRVKKEDETYQVIEMSVKQATSKKSR